jgi:Uma2 family endonuclease
MEAGGIRMTTTATRPMTLEEFSTLPEGPPYYEFEGGELIPVTSPTRQHQDVLAALVQVLRPFVRERKLGAIFLEVDVYLPDGRVLIPDLAFLSTERLHLVDPKDDKIHGAPDLLVEITSSAPARDRVHKFRVYYENGVPWYWIIDAETLAIEEYHATPDGYLRTASIAEGEEFLPQLFPGPLLNLATLVDTAS